ncbi:MAG: acyl-CoA dehydratase activase [Planctomycetota bacterium]
MITAGIDCGSKDVKAVVLRDAKVIGKSRVLAGLDTAAAVSAAYDQALAQAKLARSQIARVVATGAGRKEVAFSPKTVTEVGAAARGANHLFPQGRTVIDVGAEEGRAIKVDGKGKVVDFAVNEKCAAGAGAFTEAMARALEVPLEELGALSLQSQQAIPMNAQCAVFAESEVVSLVHRKTPKPDIARAVLDAIADRITSMVRRVGIEEAIVLIGGVAKNVGFVRGLEEDLGIKVLIPADPEYVGALGAALIAAEE